MKVKLPLALIIAAVGLGPPLLAQSMFDDLGPAPAAGAVDSVAAGYSFSAKAEVDHGGKVGEVQVGHYDLSDTVRLPGPNDLRFLAGIFWSYDDLGRTGAVPLPSRLEAKGVSLGVIRRISPDWSLIGMTRLGFAGDAAGVSSSSFDVSGSVIANRRVSSEFSWDLGAGAMLRGRYRVLPVLGARWTLAPDWTLSVGFPRTALVYQASDRLTLDAGIRFQGGGYRVTAAPAPGLGNTYLDYHEFRLGCGADYRVAEGVSVALDGGVALSRQFDYYNRNYSLDGASAGYFRLRVTLRL